MKTSKQLKGMVKAFFCICQNTVSSLFSDKVDSFPSQNHQKLRMNIWFRTSLHGGNVMSVMMTWNERSENITNTKRHENDSVTVRQAEHSFYLTFKKKIVAFTFCNPRNMIWLLGRHHWKNCYRLYDFSDFQTGEKFPSLFTAWWDCHI